MNTRFRALTQWPAHRARTPDDDRKKAPFVGKNGRPTPYETTLAELEHELSMLHVDDAVLQIDVKDPKRDIRVDGFIRADATVKSPAVVLTLESLRRVDRFKCVGGGEQYRGFAQIASTSTPALTSQQSAEVLARYSATPAGPILDRHSAAEAAFKVARKRTHPDSGGNSGDFTLVTEAGRVLAAHHGVPSL